MNGDDRAGQVLEIIKRHGRQLASVAETRCPYDGRLLGAAYQFPDGLWIWSVGHREPPAVARRQVAAFYLDALDECQTAEEERACYAAASEALSADTRQLKLATPAVMKVQTDPTNTGCHQSELSITYVK